MNRRLRFAGASAAGRAALLAALVALFACNSESRNYGPTAPPQLPAGVVYGEYFLNLLHGEDTRSVEVELRVDDVTLYSGPLYTGRPWDYDVSPLSLAGNLGGLPVGRHTLTLRVTRQESSPDTYEVTAYVKVGGQDVSSWHESATVTTGGTWTGEFVLQ